MINIVKECIINIWTWRFVCCNIHFSKVSVILKMCVATYDTSSQILWNLLLHNVYHRLAWVLFFSWNFDGWRTRVLKQSYFKRRLKVFFVVVSSCIYLLGCCYSFKRFDNVGMTGPCVKTLACALLFQFLPMTQLVLFFWKGGTLNSSS